MDVGYDDHPQILRAGWEGAVVFERLIRLMGRRGFDGVIPPEYLDADYLARSWAIPIRIVTRGLASIIEVGLITPEGEIPGWGKWKPTSIERTRRYREKLNSSLSNELDALSASLNVTDVTVTRGASQTQTVTSDQTRPDQIREEKTSHLEFECAQGTAPGAPSQEARRTSPRDKKGQSPEAIEVATYLLDAIRSHTPDFTPVGGDDDATRAKWARDIDKAIRVDGRTPERLRKAIDWIHRTPGKGEFWRPNVMSGKKLRDQYETMRAQAANPVPGKKAEPVRVIPDL